MKLDYFISIEEHIRILQDVGNKYECNILFRRFKTPKFHAGYYCVTEAAREAAAIYIAGDYREIWISLSELPKHSEDWDFIDRAQDQLIVIENGRESGDVVELSRLRVFARHSQMRPVFQAVKRQVTKICSHVGMYGSRGSFYRSMLCAPALCHRVLKERDTVNHKNRFFCQPIAQD